MFNILEENGDMSLVQTCSGPVQIGGVVGRMRGETSASEASDGQIGWAKTEDLVTAAEDSRMYIIPCFLIA